MPDIFDPIAWTVARRLGGGNGSGGGVAIKNQDKTITENGTYKADSGYTGLGTVNVNVPTPSGTIDITENGSYDVTNFATALVEIAASGGGVNFSTTPFSAMACGTVTPSGRQSSLTVTHNLGKTPKFLWIFTEAMDVVWAEASTCTSSIMSYVVTDTTGQMWNIKTVMGKGNASWSEVKHITSLVVQGGHLSNSAGYKPAGVSAVNATSATFKFQNNNSFAVGYFLPITYTWIAMA